MAFPAGQTLAGFADGLSQGLDRGRQLQLDRLRALEEEQQRRLRELQIQAATQTLADAAQAKADFATVAARGQAGQQTLAAGIPEVPGVPAVPAGAPQPMADYADPGATVGMAPGTPAVAAVPGVPAIPPIQGAVQTQAELAEKVGADVVGRVALHPRGGEAMKAAGVLTPDEKDRRIRMAKAKQEGAAMRREVKTLQDKGDTIGARYKEAAALERIAEVSDDPVQYANIMAKVSELRKEANALQQKPEELRKANIDTARIAAAMTKYHNDPSPENVEALIEAHTGSISEHGMKRAFEFLANMEKGFMTEMKDPVLTKFLQRYGAAMNRQARAGQQIDNRKAFVEALNEDPTATGALIPKILASKNVPRMWQEMIGGDVGKRFEYPLMQDAYHLAKTQLPPGASDAEINKKTEEIYTRLRLRGSKESPAIKDGTAKLIQGGMRVEQRNLHDLTVEAQKIREKSFGRTKEGKAKLETIEKERTAIKQRLARSRRMLGELGAGPPEEDDDDDVIAPPGGATTPGPAGQPQVAPKTGQPATPTSKALPEDVVKVRPAGKAATKQQTSVELQRLISGGMPKARAIAAMQDQGYPIK